MSALNEEVNYNWIGDERLTAVLTLYIWQFHVVALQRTGKKFTDVNPAFLRVVAIVVVAVIVAKATN